MKKTAILAMMALAFSAFAQKSEADFEGYFMGAQLGRNYSKAMHGDDMTKHNEIYPGLIIGHSTAYHGVLYGVEGFADFHKNSVTGRDFGMAFKIGKAFGDVLVSGRAGITGRSPSFRPHFGLGIEYKLDKNLSLTGLITDDESSDEGVKRSNTNVVAGMNYYFR